MSRKHKGRFNAWIAAISGSILAVSLVALSPGVAVASSPPTTPQGLYWGVDSVAYGGTKLAGVQSAYGVTPGFWGQYIADCESSCGGNLSYSSPN